jgi:hypothetical protein
VNTNYNLKTTLANSLVADENSQSGFSLELELLKQTNHYLEQVKEITAIFGKERVLELMRLGGGRSISTLPDYEPSSAPPNAKSEESSGVDLIDEVKSLGLELNSQLINLISDSTVSQVKTVIAKYRTYRQVTNPEGLFYRILTNERKQAIQ